MNAINSMRHARQRRVIVREILPNAIHRFLVKNQDYGTGSDEFGLKAQVIDISRKYKKIKAAVWDGEELVGEPLEEVLEDLIGHLLIMLELIHYGREVARGVREVARSTPELNFTADQWKNWYNEQETRLFEILHPCDGTRLMDQELPPEDRVGNGG